MAKTDEERYFDAARDLADEVCPSCREYKGMTEDPDTGERYCIFCQ